MPMPTVAIDVPSAQVLADQASIISEPQFVMDCCKRLLADLAKPEEERDQLMPLALWSSAVLAYGRCFSKGKRFALSNDDVKNLPLHGAVMKFHHGPGGARQARRARRQPGRGSEGGRRPVARAERPAGRGHRHLRQQPRGRQRRRRPPARRPCL